MSRLVNQLEKMFRALNADMFNNELDTPVITVTPTSRAYAHYTPWNAWEAGDIHRREINIASGTLNRPLEDITASLLHEMVHMYNYRVEKKWWRGILGHGPCFRKHRRRIKRDFGIDIMAFHDLKYRSKKVAPPKLWEKVLIWLIDR
jgi:hypothetical protein